MGHTDSWMDGWVEADPLIIILAIIATIVAVAWHYRTHQPYHARPRPKVEPPLPRLSASQTIPAPPPKNICSVCGGFNLSLVTPLSNFAGDPWSLADCADCRTRVYARAT